MLERRKTAELSTRLTMKKDRLRCEADSSLHDQCVSKRRSWEMEKWMELNLSGKISTYFSVIWRAIFLSCKQAFTHDLYVYIVSDLFYVAIKSDRLNHLNCYRHISTLLCLPLHSVDRVLLIMKISQLGSAT